METANNIRTHRNTKRTEARGALLSQGDLNALLGEVARSVRDEEPSMREDFALLARTLGCAIEAAERYLLPSIVAVDPVGAQNLRANHAAIRQALSSISVEFDLGVVRARRFDAVANELRRHTATAQSIVAVSGVVQSPRALNVLLSGHCAG